MKKIEIIKDFDQNTQKMTLTELKQAIDNPKRVVVADDGSDNLFFVTFDGTDYKLIGSDGIEEAVYSNLSSLEGDYDLFLA